MINFYKIFSYFLTIIIGFTGLILFTMSVRELLYFQEKGFGAVWGMLLAVVMIVASCTIYDSLWRF